MEEEYVSTPSLSRALKLAWGPEMNNDDDDIDHVFYLASLMFKNNHRPQPDGWCLSQGSFQRLVKRVERDALSDVHPVPEFAEDAQYVLRLFKREGLLNH